MGTQWGQVVKEQSKTSSGIAEFTKCQSAAFTYSSLSLIAVTGVTLGILQTKPFKAIELKHRFLASLLMGCFTAWYLARTRTRYCRELWIVLDEKHPPKNEH